jgi:hypothetical protein
MNYTRQNVPYDTGKVQIGLLYTRPPPVPDEFDEQIQCILLGIKPEIPHAIKLAVRYAAAFVFVYAILFLSTGARHA